MTKTHVALRGSLPPDMDLSNDDLEQIAEADRREVDALIRVDMATCSKAGQLDWWVKERQQWLGRVRWAARDLLESDAVAHVVTLDEDGGPQVTAAWVGLDGDEIVFATLPDQRKLKNLRRDPRIALSIPSTTTNEWGIARISCRVRHRARDRG
jgi:hypothetical protein